MADWDCGACTLLNPHSAVACAVCGTPRPPVAFPAAAPAHTHLPAAPPVASPLYTGNGLGAAPRDPVRIVSGQAAAEHAECPICFEPLHAQPCVALFGRDGRRACGHYFHQGCCTTDHLNRCPLCRAAFTAARPLPDFRDTATWFGFVDADGSGALDQRELMEALKCVLPLDWRRIEKEIPENWAKWDPNGDGTITVDELRRPEGLLEWLQQFTGVGRPPPPPIHDKGGWFDFWDEDGSGELCHEETVRALVKTFGVSADRHKLAMMRETVAAIWGCFDLDGGGGIDRAEFLLPNDGLADTIIASISFI